MLATHEVGSAVPQVLEQLQGVRQSFFGAAALLHLSSGNFMRKFIL